MKKLLFTLVCLFAVCLFAACNTNENEESEPVVKIVDVKLTDEEYAFVIKKGNTALKDDFNEFLAGIKASGQFAAILAKYFEGEGEKVGVSISTGAVENTEGKFVVATNCPFEPFEYVGDDGKAYGIDIEIAKLYADAKNLELVIKNIEFDAIFTEVDNGFADIGMAGITVNAEREALYDFTTTYYQASQKLVVAANDTTFDNCKTAEDVEKLLSELKDKKVGYQIGTTGNWYVAGDEGWDFDGFANIEAKGYKTAQLGIQDIVNGQIYAVVVDEAPAAAMVKAINEAN